MYYNDFDWRRFFREAFEWAVAIAQLLFGIFLILFAVAVQLRWFILCLTLLWLALSGRLVGLF